MNTNPKNIGAKAQIDFHCLDDNCTGVIEFNLADISRKNFQAVCPKCHKTYEFDAALRDKLSRMLHTFSATGYEIADFSDYRNLVDKKIVPQIDKFR